MKERVQERTAELGRANADLQSEIADRKRVEAALQESEARLKDFAEAASDWFWEMDADLCFTTRSDRFFEVCHTPAEAVLGKTWKDLVGEAQTSADPEKWRRHFNDLEAHRPIRDFEYSVVGSDGKKYDVRLNGFPVFDDAGNFVGYRGAGSDITERKRAEVALAQLHRTQRLEALGELAGGVAHEFNNLLTVIGGFARAGLKKVEDAGRVRDCLKEVIEASDRAANVSRQLLVFSRTEVGEVNVINVGKELDGLQKMLRSLTEESIALHIDIGDDQAKVEVDPTQFGQAIVNLAINARDAMPQGGNLTIGCHAADLDAEYFLRNPAEKIVSGRYVRISVSDSGSGIDPTTLEHIFEPFFTTKKAGQGTGLGLSMVFGLVKQSAGYIDVESTLGVGTTFSIYLPICEKELTREGTIIDDNSTGEGKIILLAEDEAQLRHLARMTLEEMGYVVLTAADGDGALKLHEEHGENIDLLLTDIVMPNMGGLELADIVIARRPMMKVVYMTGYAPELSEHLKDLGDDRLVLRKPFEPAELSRIVRHALEA